MADGKVLGIVAVIVIVVILAVVYLAVTPVAKTGGSYNSTSTTNGLGSGSTTNGYNTTGYNKTGYNSTGYNKTGTNSSAAKQVPLLMTDPPHVPAGTKAAVVSYSAVQVETAGTSGWTAVNGSGTVDLMAIQNSSRVIGYAMLKSNATIQAVKFSVNSAYVIVNNTTYNMSTPSTLSFNVTGNGKVNQNASVLIDMTPTIAATHNDNSTQFTLVPSSKTVVVANSGASADAGVGAYVSLNANAKAALAASTPLIVVTNASVASSNGSTNLSITVKNNGNSTVVLNNVALYGPQNVTATANALLNVSILGVGDKVTASLLANISAMQATYWTIGSGSQLQTYSGSSGSSQTVAPGASATLKYNGIVSYDNGKMQSTTKSGSRYQIVVTGDDTATASTNVTAK